MVADDGLQELIQRIVENAYPELDGSDITAKWGRIAGFATVSWTSNRLTITIKCNTQTKKWHEAAVIGLLSHELSHTVQCNPNRAENNTDIDVIQRGLGPYLAVERAISGKYEDHIIRRGKDRYLGYRSIRSCLNTDELIQLDALLQEMRLIPQMNVGLPIPHQDFTILKTDTKTELSIDGHKFTIEGMIDDAQIEIITNELVSHIYVNGHEIGKFDIDDN
jgi:hypothetical protein